ncbi:YitT family protein [Kallipyga gabonensis]|uniref:YitT family protein n=1 Tax=Kallipyga gabonensis TaxID=1686287 RepID=UPI0009404019|nr:YitT family protein [Kallipyga gabonensis]
MQATLKKMFLIFIGSFIMSLGATYFYVPYNLAAGGVSGLSIILNQIFPFLPVGLLMNLGNILFFILGFIFLDRSFGIYTLFGAFAYSLPVFFMERYFMPDQPLTDSPIIALIIGASLYGVGLTIVFLQNASTGGTDIVTKILNVHFGLSYSTGFLISDGIVVLLSGIFISLNKALYAVVAIMVQSAILDYAITGFDRKMVLNIITKKQDEVCAFIINDLKRGVTLMSSRGGFTRQEKETIVTIVGKQEYTKIKTLVERIDPTAFFYVYSASEVMGEGFTYPKTKQVEKIIENVLEP